MERLDDLVGRTGVMNPQGPGSPSGMLNVTFLGVSKRFPFPGVPAQGLFLGVPNSLGEDDKILLGDFNGVRKIAVPKTASLPLYLIGVEGATMVSLTGSADLRWMQSAD